MAVASMTGFARVEGSSGDHAWHWEIRSVNARGLDVRLRLPTGFERLEPMIRERVQARLTRGSLTAGLQLRRAEAGGSVRINHAALEVILEACERLMASAQVAPPRADGLLGLKGVLEVEEETESEEARATLESELLGTLGQAIDLLVAMRRAEGARLSAVLVQRLDEIDALTAQAESNHARTPAAIARRLGDQIAQLLEAAPSLDADRLHQEAVLLATKADIREELDRLAAHVVAGRALLVEEGAVGRKLEFLAQEFNREANTLCSKSNDVALTRIGLELKAVVDQLREQVQNVE